MEFLPTSQANCIPGQLLLVLHSWGSFKFTLSFIPMGSLVIQLVKNLPAMQETQV